jgi:methionyl-tRNA synthetase
MPSDQPSPAPRPLTVITVPPPTPNGPLHLGHLSGPFVAADVAARAARASGATTLTVCGLDAHQNYVPAKAADQGRSPDAVLDEYEGLVRQAFRAARVSHDLFADPRADAGYRDAVARLLDELITEKAITVEDVKLSRCDDCGATLHHAYVAGRCPGCGSDCGGGTCEACGIYTTAQNLVQAHCTRCGGAPVPFTAQVPVIRLESYRAELTQTWARAVIPARFRAVLGQYLTAGLPDVPLAYPTNWGIPAANDGATTTDVATDGQSSDEQRIDVWAEMALGYIVGIGQRLDPAAGTLEEYLTAWQRVGECWYFLGLDNAFYYGVLFPAIFAAAGLAPAKVAGLVINRFYRLDGLKFSTSRNHAIWAHEFLAEQDPALVRMFMCWDRPDRYESGFTRAAYAHFRDWAQAAIRSGGSLPPDLADAEIRRAGHALEFGSFDPGLALRCLLAAGPDQGQAPALFAALTGDAG